MLNQLYAVLELTSQMMHQHVFGVVIFPPLVENEKKNIINSAMADWRYGPASPVMGHCGILRQFKWKHYLR